MNNNWICYVCYQDYMNNEEPLIYCSQCEEGKICKNCIMNNPNHTFYECGICRKKLIDRKCETKINIYSSINTNIYNQIMINTENVQINNNGNSILIYLMLYSILFIIFLFLILSFFQDILYHVN